MLPLPIPVQEVRTEEERPLVPLVVTQWYCRSHCGPGQAETILLQRTLSLKMVASLMMPFSLLLAGREKLLGRVRVGAGWVCTKDAPGVRRYCDLKTPPVGDPATGGGGEGDRAKAGEGHDDEHLQVSSHGS